MADFDAHRLAPSAEELSCISKAVEHLWSLDINRLTPGTDYALNLQHGKSFHQEGDFASEPLFQFVNEGVLNDRPTFSTFMALFDNYIAEAGQTEVVTNEERAENKAFLHAIMETPVMKYVHHYLLASGKTHAQDSDAFILVLNQLWFELYTRTHGGKLDSSGFEHVFIGEIKDGQVTGMHNWIRIYLEEKQKTLDYRGFIKPRYRGIPTTSPDDHSQLLSMQFSWNGVLKKVGTSMIGVSPEFEVALYTLIFFSQPPGKTNIQLGPYKVIQT